ncbi:hypothetical protein ACQKE4_17545 [Halomonas sp. NPDC076908]
MSIMLFVIVSLLAALAFCCLGHTLRIRFLRHHFEQTPWVL